MTSKDYLNLINGNTILSEEDRDNKIKEYNKELIDKYPWLKPVSVWTGEPLKDYDYKFTLLDQMPEGWRIAFGDQMCEELQAELKRFDYVNDYMIVQIKEKFGGLRWYTGPTPIGVLGKEEYEVEVPADKYWFNVLNDNQHFVEVVENREDGSQIIKAQNILDRCNLDKIVDKYEDLSFKTCIVCGEPAEYISTGWISPFCTKCIEESCEFLEKPFRETLEKEYVPIEEFFKKVKED